MSEPAGATAGSPAEGSPPLSVPSKTGRGGSPPPRPSPSRRLTGRPALEVLAALAVAYTLFFARAILLPLTLALVLALLFRPLVRHLRKRWRVPEYYGAAAVLAGTVLLLGSGLSLLALPAEDFVRAAPEKLDDAAAKLRSDPLFDTFLSVRKKLDDSAGMSLDDQDDAMPSAEGEPPRGDDPDYAAIGAAGPQAADEVRRSGGVETETEDRPTVVVEERPPSLMNRVFNSAPDALGGFLLAIVFLYFLLAEGDAILANVIALLPTTAGKREAVGLTRAAERGVSRYLMQVSMINAALGVCIGVAMWLVGLPNPALWGVMAALLNFMPYVGAFIGSAVVFLVAYLEPNFELPRAALAPLADERADIRHEIQQRRHHAPERRVR
ncbi:MAG: AI-2E family transporter, partial [Planctomycetota bacterium]